MIWAAVAMGMLIAAIVAANLYDRRQKRDGSWYPTGSQMKRFVDGRWQTRPMTEEEARDWKDQTAW